MSRVSLPAASMESALAASCPSGDVPGDIAGQPGIWGCNSGGASGDNSHEISGVAFGKRTDRATVFLSDIIRWTTSPPLLSPLPI